MPELVAGNHCAQRATLVSPLALNAVVRITGNTRTFRNMSSLQEIFAFCNAIRDAPNHVEAEPGENHWRIFRSLCLEDGIKGPLVTDAWYAALAIEWSCELATMDRDFARFPGLRWSAPGA